MPEGRSKRINLDGLRLIIFDLDGTLVDAYPAIVESFNFTMRNLGYPEKRQEIIRKAVGWGDENLLKPFIKEEDLSKAVSIYRRHHKKSLLKKSFLYPGVKRLLNFLKQRKLKIAIASNRPTRFTKILIRHLGLDRYLDYVLCADRIKYIKPHPQILNKIMEHFGVSAKQSLYVGDMTIDVQAGRSAGIKTVVVSTGSSTKSQLKRQRPFRVINRVSDLLKILL